MLESASSRQQLRHSSLLSNGDLEFFVREQTLQMQAEQQQAEHPQPHQQKLTHVGTTQIPLFVLDKRDLSKTPVITGNRTTQTITSALYAAIHSP